MMSNDPLTCDTQRAESYLRNVLTDDDQAAFERHLDDCVECRTHLEFAAAADDVWSDVRESLQDDVLNDQPSGTGEDSEFACQAVLDLLAPTDDDRMFGRLGSYEVVGAIGSGGMGVVLKAFDAALNRNVAIKVLAPHLGCSGAARKRFAREAQAAAAVVHDNVIEIHGVADTNGLPYLVCQKIRKTVSNRRMKSPKC